MLVMSEYFIGVSRKFTNSSSRRNPFNRSKNGKVAFYVSESLSVKSKKIKNSTYYLYKYFKPRYKRRIAWCTNCENKFKAICKNGQVITACPNCEEWYKTLSKRLLFNLGMADTGINKKLQTGIITITAILTYLLCESKIIEGVVPSV